MDLCSLLIVSPMLGTKHQQQQKSILSRQSFVRITYCKELKNHDSLIYFVSHCVVDFILYVFVYRVLSIWWGGNKSCVAVWKYWKLTKKVLFCSFSSIIFLTHSSTRRKWKEILRRTFILFYEVKQFFS